MIVIASTVFTKVTFNYQLELVLFMIGYSSLNVIGAHARVAVGSLLGDDETVGENERVATDRRGLRLAA